MSSIIHGFNITFTDIFVGTSETGTCQVRVRKYTSENGYERYLGQIIAHPTALGVLGSVAFDWGGGAYIDYAPCDDILTADPTDLPYTDTFNVYDYEAGRANLDFTTMAFARFLANLDGDDVDVISQVLAEARF